MLPTTLLVAFATLTASLPSRSERPSKAVIYNDLEPWQIVELDQGDVPEGKDDGFNPGSIPGCEKIWEINGTAVGNSESVSYPEEWAIDGPMYDGPQGKIPNEHYFDDDPDGPDVPSDIPPGGAEYPS